MDVIAWLLDSDPAIRWQVLRDLTDVDPSADRARVATEGLGARLLAAQAPDGAWYADDAPSWLTTLNHASALRTVGVDPAHPAFERLATGFRWHPGLGGKGYFDGETEPCINGRVLALGAYCGRPSAALAERLVADQLADGGWNCDAPTCGSYHSTICVLEGLLEYERATGSREVAAARARGEAYLLERDLFRRRSTGELAAPGFLELGFPIRYHYDVLRGLDYLRAAGVAAPAAALERLAEKRQPDGRWLLDVSHANDFSIDEQVGAPSRWITLFALRVTSSAVRPCPERPAAS